MKKTTENIIKTLEEKLINKSLKILEKKRISRTEEKIISETIQLIQFTHGLACYRSDFEASEQ